MTRKTLIVCIILLLVLGVVPPAFAQEVDPEEGEEDTEFSCDIGVFEHPVIARIADSLEDYDGDDAYSHICDIYREGVGEYEGVVGLGRIMTAIRMKEQFGESLGELTWEELLEWHLQGNGWGQLAVAAKLAGQIEEVDAQELLDMRAEAGMGWGQILRQYGDELKGGPPCGPPPCGGPNASASTSQDPNTGGAGNGNGPPPHANAGGNGNGNGGKNR